MSDEHHLNEADVVEEFETYFADLVRLVDTNNEKYVVAMQQLKQLLALEKETLELKTKVANFTIDYSDDLDDDYDDDMVIGVSNS